MNTIINFKVLENYQIWVKFDDNTDGVIKMKPYLNSGIGIELQNIEIFKSVVIEPGGGLTWQNGFDMCPDALKKISIQNKVFVKTL